MEKMDCKKEGLYNANLNDLLYKDYIKAMKDEKFKKLVNSFKLDDKVGMKYTTKLETTVENLNNCENCPGLTACKNSVVGCVYYPKLINGKLEFNYVACKYKNKEIAYESIKRAKMFGLSNDLKNAKMSEIDISDKKRVNIIKYLKKFFDKYPTLKKGMYLHGSFGSGKTYLIAALFNELAKKNYNAFVVYYPELLSTLKSTFDKFEDTTYSDLMYELKNTDLLLIDDIGAETVTSWSRDEVLGTILQYRMENNLATFFTSNLTIEELESHLSLTKNSIDKVKSRRIIERIKQLTEDYELISINRRS